MELMRNELKVRTRCLNHQLPEDQTSLIGLVCPRCKQRLYTRPPTGRPMCFWESQPAAYGLDRRPCFVYTLIWDDFRIRSLHPAESESDARGQSFSEKCLDPTDEPNQ